MAISFFMTRKRFSKNEENFFCRILHTLHTDIFFFLFALINCHIIKRKKGLHKKLRVDMNSLEEHKGGNFVY